MEEIKREDRKKPEPQEMKPEPQETKPEEEKIITLKEAEYTQLQQRAGKAAEYWERILRLQADFENTRKRWEREKQEFVRFANEELLGDILHICDEMERSVELSRPKKQEFPSFVQGVEMILSHLHEILKKHGVVPMEAKGKIFNPNFHEALMQVEKDDVPENTVLEEFQKGYLINNKVLRIARVQVSRKKSESSEQTKPETEVSGKEKTQIEDTL